MKNRMKKIQKVFATVLLVGAALLVVTTGWGSIVLMESQNDLFAKSVRASVEEEGNIDSLLYEETQRDKTRAPEPSTFALFFSGIVGMVVSFVRKTYNYAKRIIDIVLSITAIICLSPLFLLTAILVRVTSKGPIVFKQTRVGKDGRLFEIFKFRTMRVDAEKETGPVWAAKDDPRLIPVGKFLRKAHIDEIPQFFNVLRGEMSVIGPRPERPIFVEKFKSEISDYENRLLVKPGITGLAQVWHNYDETIADVRKKIKYDLLYIRKICLWTDVRILLRTVRVVFTGEGAR